MTVKKVYRPFEKDFKLPTIRREYKVKRKEIDNYDMNILEKIYNKEITHDQTEDYVPDVYLRLTNHGLLDFNHLICLREPILPIKMCDVTNIQVTDKGKKEIIIYKSKWKKNIRSFKRVFIYYIVYPIIRLLSLLFKLLIVGPMKFIWNQKSQIIVGVILLFIGYYLNDIFGKNSDKENNIKEQEENNNE